jgi:hypothetical protein
MTSARISASLGSKELEFIKVEFFQLPCLIRERKIRQSKPINHQSTRAVLCGRALAVPSQKDDWECEDMSDVHLPQ